MKTTTSLTCLLVALAFTRPASAVSGPPDPPVRMVHYTFNGNFQDSTGGYHGNPVGDVTISGGQAHFPGGSARTNYVSVPGGPLDWSAHWLTVETWFTVEELSDWSKVWMFGTAGEESALSYIDFTVRAGGAGASPKIDFNSDSNGEVNTGGGGALVTGHQYHVVATYDYTSGNMTLYIDGVLVSSTFMGLKGGAENYSVVDVPMAQRLIGAAVNFNDADFHGCINELNLYDGVMTLAQVQDSMEAGPEGGGGTNGCVASDTTPPVVSVPNNITAEATSASGATVTFSASATDDVDGSLTPTCSPASGSTFVLGTTTVTCSATDAAGNTGSASFSVTVQDTTPPALNLPSNNTYEADRPEGRPVTFSPTASDAVSGSTPVSCNPTSGTVFSIGTTSVSCTSQDGAGNVATGSFTVTVQDTTPPVVNVPSPITAEATGPSGAAVTFTVTASDVVSGDVTNSVGCSNPSGSTFSLGTTTVLCMATDARGNVGMGSFTVTVRDTTRPTVTVPGNITREGTSPAGTPVTFSASGMDIVSGALPASCSPSSGSTFAVGTTTVTCTSTDGAGNSGQASFQVTVVDTTAPVVTVPATITLEATGPSGRVVTYSTSASDIVDTSVPVTCSHPSGSTFPLGQTLVTCTGQDDAGNTGVASFLVRIVDTRPPLVRITLSAKSYTTTNPSGRVVTYSASATDVVDGNVSVSCTPASGTMFPVGTTTIRCTASDSRGNTTSTTAKVTVTYTAP
ncbi:MAG: HYR domain-containing protein [Myxococcota bacterium]